jgi:hypothetical protein
VSYKRRPCIEVGVSARHEPTAVGLEDSQHRIEEDDVAPIDQLSTDDQILEPSGIPIDTAARVSLEIDGCPPIHRAGGLAISKKSDVAR